LSIVYDHGHEVFNKQKMSVKENAHMSHPTGPGKLPFTFSFKFSKLKKECMGCISTIWWKILYII